MEKQMDQNFSSFVQRRLSQVKVLARLLEHEINGAKGSKDVTLGRDLAENVLDTLEIFVEDCDRSGGERAGRGAAEPVKPAVTRLN